MSAFKFACSVVSFCSLVPTPRAAIRKIGSKINDAIVICQLSANIVTKTTDKLITFPTIPPKVEVKARCAPKTSPFSRLTNAPVWALVKNAIDCRCT